MIYSEHNVRPICPIICKETANRILLFFPLIATYIQIILLLHYSPGVSLMDLSVDSDTLFELSKITCTWCSDGSTQPIIAFKHSIVLGVNLSFHINNEDSNCTLLLQHHTDIHICQEPKLTETMNSLINQFQFMALQNHLQRKAKTTEDSELERFASQGILRDYWNRPQIWSISDECPLNHPYNALKDPNCTSFPKNQKMKGSNSV